MYEKLEEYNKPTKLMVTHNTNNQRNAVMIILHLEHIISFLHTEVGIKIIFLKPRYKLRHCSVGKTQE